MLLYLNVHLMQSSSALSATLLIKKSSRSPRLHKAFGAQRLIALRESLLQSIIPTLDATLLGKRQKLMPKWVRWIGLVSENRRENLTKRKETLDRLQSDRKEAMYMNLAAMHTYFVKCVQGLSASQPCTSKRLMVLLPSFEICWRLSCKKWTWLGSHGKRCYWLRIHASVKLLLSSCSCISGIPNIIRKKLMLSFTPPPILYTSSYLPHPSIKDLQLLYPWF